MNLRPLPAKVNSLLQQHHAPPLLVAHLRLVHDVAWKLTESIGKSFPQLAFDKESVLFGAATHDIGKVIYPKELTEVGSEHETAGRELLLKAGFPENLARFAFTHGGPRREPNPTLEDLLVQTADAIWKGKRYKKTESELIQAIAIATNMAEWDVFSRIDDLMTELSMDSDERLAYQFSCQDQQDT